MALKLVPKETSIAFTNFRMIAFVISAIAIVGSIIAFTSLGLNYGIDFRGGATIEIGPAEDQTFTEQSLAEVRSAVDALNLGDVKVQEIDGVGEGDGTGIVVFLEQQSGDQVFSDYCLNTIEETAGTPEEKAQQTATACVKQTLKDTLGAGIQERRVDVVGPTVSGELVQSGIRAVLIAVGFMLIYIWFRFEWQFSLGAIVALVHDVILTIGMFAITSLEFNLSIIAALLTIVGYSMNDTVVVYDRVRENLRKFKKKPLVEVLDLSVNQTLSRTIMTSVTTLLALVALLVFGGPVLRGFTAAMIWGVFIGTYSSIFIASPLLTITGVKRDWSNAAAA